jgi:hypothetical protein
MYDLRVTSPGRLEGPPAPADVEVTSSLSRARSVATTRLTPSIARSSRRPYRIHDVAGIPRSEDADDALLHLAFFGNEVFYVMHQMDDARVLLVTLRKAVDLLTERLGPSTAELPAFWGEGHRSQKKRRRPPPQR